MFIAIDTEQIRMAKERGGFCEFAYVADTFKELQRVVIEGDSEIGCDHGPGVIAHYLVVDTNSDLRATFETRVNITFERVNIRGGVEN